jgi:hypothetical protein
VTNRIAISQKNYAKKQSFIKLLLSYYSAAKFGLSLQPHRHLVTAKACQPRSPLKSALRVSSTAIFEFAFEFKLELDDSEDPSPDILPRRFEPQAAMAAAADTAETPDPASTIASNSPEIEKQQEIRRLS